MNNRQIKIAVIGSGPAGLMFADTVASQLKASEINFCIDLFEAEPGIGRKLYIAGASGFNIGRKGSKSDFLKAFKLYPQNDPFDWEDLFDEVDGYPMEKWIRFLESLAEPCFVGSTGRIFTKSSRARLLVRAWTQRLKDLGVHVFLRHPVDHIEINKAQGQNQFILSCNKLRKGPYDFLCLATGGASYVDEATLNGPLSFLKQSGLKIQSWQAGNAGLCVEWHSDFLKEADGLALKNIRMGFGERLPAECTFTKYGLEGTAVYTLSALASADDALLIMDLKPSWSEEQLLEKLSKPRERLSPMRRIDKTLNLDTGAKALLFHFLKGTLIRQQPPRRCETLSEIATLIKNFPLQVRRQSNYAKAISTTGGVDLLEVNQNMMVKKIDHLFLVGEILDWHAPTGGYLIPTCIAQGYRAGRAVAKACTV